MSHIGALGLVPNSNELRPPVLSHPPVRPSASRPRQGSCTPEKRWHGLGGAYVETGAEILLITVYWVYAPQSRQGN